MGARTGVGSRNIGALLVAVAALATLPASISSGASTKSLADFGDAPDGVSARYPGALATKGGFPSLKSSR